MNRFNALLLREWMQHWRGWLILALSPPLIILLVSVFVPMNFDVEVDGDTVVQHVPDALLIALGSLGIIGVGTMVIGWVSALFLAPGLARRDHQDRSIEFWLSLPTGHAQSLAATLLAHLVLLPLAALGIGTAGGLLVSLALVAKDWGLGTWLSLPWPSITAALGVVLLRLGIGVLLATLWLSPLILIAMAASAWFKRLGVPAVAAAIALVGIVLDKFAGTKVVWNLLQGLLENVGQALLSGGKDGDFSIRIKGVEPAEILQTIPGLAMHDLGVALQGLLSAGFVAALAVAAAAFALLVLRRSRGA